MIEGGDDGFVLADIPGLIEGASEGAGLGVRFLGHVERCAVLIHLIDGIEAKPDTAYRAVRAELEAYGHGLIDKPEVIALTKIDAMTPEAIRKARRNLERASGTTVYPISAASGEGLAALVEAVRAHVRAARLTRRIEAEAELEMVP
jgi:GTP-binding protein